MRNLVKYWMTPEMVHVAATDPARRALEEMEDNAIRHVLVFGDSGALEGIVSDRDAIRITLQNAGRVFDLDGCTVGAIMTRAPLETIEPESTLQEAAQRMVEAQVNALPVMEGGRLVGILTHHDILGALVEGALV